ncbi:MAG: hypothetical protein HQM13_12220 [SAR324 cluster bacterium]|nr:hypothetical protein [SAR324 cluster bacterium]
MPEGELTFNALLLQAIDKGAVASALLDQTARQELLDQLKDVTEDQGKPKMFDRISLKQIAALFDVAEKFYTEIQDENHPAHLIYGNPTEWFQQSYKFMYDPVSFMEVVRFFAGGKTQEEKEITFRTLISKLIKTQDTVRTIAKNKEFIKKYLEENNLLQEKYPALYAKEKNLPQPLSAEVSVMNSLKAFVDDTSQSCLTLFEELDIELPDPARPPAESKQYYEALVLTIRHAPEDLFGELGSDDYSILVEGLGKVCQQTQLYSSIFLFQHVKRAYLIYWLVHTLRQNDREGSSEFYQGGKAEVYAKFKPITIDQSIIQQLGQREHLDNQEVIDAETLSLNQLTEDDLYQLLLRMYTSYKNDELMAQNMPLAPQALSASGDITWDKQNMVAQVNRKVKVLEATGGGAGKSASKFSSMFVALKKATKVFTVASKRVDEKKKKALASQQAGLSAEPSTPAEPPPPPPPPLKIGHTGVKIEPCFPLPKRDCLNPVPGQKQDMSFNNSDDQAGVAPLEQEGLINMFNLENLPNQPSVNPNYFKMGEAISLILESYDSEVQRLKKMYVSGVNKNSFTEQVLYLKIKEDVILTLGITQMGEGKNIGNLPKKETSYFRLFVKGDLSKGLTKYKVPSALKEFQTSDKSTQFKEIAIPTHYKEAPKYQAVLVDALALVIESLPQSVFDKLNAEDGFISLLQEKAKILIEQQGIKMERGEQKN